MRHSVIISFAHEKYGALVKRSRRRPLTAESRVRFPDALPSKNLKVLNLQNFEIFYCC